MKKVLVILIHPSVETSTINATLFNVAQSIYNVTTIDLYKEYSGFNIDIVKEQQRLLAHDVIIFLFPTYWYSTPALLKEWQDRVLEYGFAYGSTGDKLHGKSLLCATSTGSDVFSYLNKETNELTIRDLLLPIERMAEDTGLNFVEPLVLFGAQTAVKENRLQPHVDEFVRLLNSFK
ncbi:NAD(P)H-dependent oxidoreductase [Photobacterium frigidiphilum]|uniref:NAD(P)H-dependent oxidoreductase n=1 Tax=Photobacterium frigidiphilum TaxID=264736 RepID=UPI003D10566E